MNRPRLSPHARRPILDWPNAHTHPAARPYPRHHPANTTSRVWATPCRHYFPGKLAWLSGRTFHVYDMYGWNSGSKLLICPSSKK